MAAKSGAACSPRQTRCACATGRPTGLPALTHATTRAVAYTDPWLTGALRRPCSRTATGRTCCTHGGCSLVRTASGGSSLVVSALTRTPVRLCSLTNRHASCVACHLRSLTQAAYSGTSRRADLAGNRRQRVALWNSCAFHISPTFCQAAADTVSGRPRKPC